MLWWYCDDVRMMSWWCHDDVMMMLRWCYDVMMMLWWCYDDGMMMLFWCYDDVMMVLWSWCYYVIMMFLMLWWYFDAPPFFTTCGLHYIYHTIILARVTMWSSLYHTIILALEWHAPRRGKKTWGDLLVLRRQPSHCGFRIEKSKHIPGKTKAFDRARNRRVTRTSDPEQLQKWAAQGSPTPVQV